MNSFSKKNEPKEWTLVPQLNKYLVIADGPRPSGTMQVIEKSAYDALKAENDRLKLFLKDIKAAEQCQRMLATNLALENEKMLAELEFYMRSYPY